MQCARFGVVFLGIILFIFGILMSGVGVLGYVLPLVGVGCLASLFFIVPMFNMDYEYIYCDGQIDFDRITGGEKRKHQYRIDLDNVEILAPEKSHQLDSYRSQTGLKIKDFSSRDPEAKKFCAFTTDGPDKVYVIFEPSEKMIELARQKSPRKVFLD